MSIKYLDILDSELSELFQHRDLGPNWHDDLIIVQVTDPEKVTADKEEEFALDTATITPRQEGFV